MKYYLKDGSDDVPKLRVYLNLDNLDALPGGSRWPGLRGDAALEQLKADGFDGVQRGNFVDFHNAAILPHCGLDRINRPEEAEAVFADHVAQGDQCLSLHVGWGMESDTEVDRLVDAVLSASTRQQMPAFIETHRATITQDMWRTVEMTKRFPELLFNGDFSHYYCGQEMVYGDFEAKLDFLQPVFDRVGFMHGRIAAPGYMQAPIEAADTRPATTVAGARDYLADFKRIWARAMAGFRKNAGPGSVLIFAPELLRPDIYYARVFPDAQGALSEESDRYEQALLYQKLARALFTTR